MRLYARERGMEITKLNLMRSFTSLQTQFSILEVT